jgi:LysM repeat protein
VCKHSVPKYDAWAVKTGQPVKLVAIRGSYSHFASSAGVDTGGGHLDVEMDGYDANLQRQTETDGRDVDLAACLRLWAGNNHVHTLDPECPDLSPQACAQFEDFRKGLDGLVDNAPLGGDLTHMAHILYLYDHRHDAKPAPTPTPVTTTPRPLPWKGADVSRYTALSTIEADAKALDFELVMCTEGKGYNAPSYPQEIGLVRAGTAMAGAVHYAWPENGWQADYAHFKSYAGLRAGEAGALDFEPWHTSQPNADPATFPEYVVGWADAFKADFGVDPLFYAPDYFVNQIKSHATAAQWARIKTLPFWKAGVNGAYVSSPSGGPGDSLGFDTIAAWQWSDKPLDQDLLYIPWSKVAVSVGGTSGSTAFDAVPVVFIKPPAPVASHATTYVVRSGDTLSAIGAKYHVSVAQLVAWNHIANPNLIHVGEHLTLVAPASSQSYTVKGGDTLSAIAARFHVTVAQLATWNHIANVNLINVGQRLVIGKAAPAGTPAAAHRYYTVQKGDSLSAIASKFHTSVAQLVSWNGVKNPNLIYPGQRFRVG